MARLVVVHVHDAATIEDREERTEDHEAAARRRVEPGPDHPCLGELDSDSLNQEKTWLTTMLDDASAATSREL